MKTTFDTTRFARAYGWMRDEIDLDADGLIDLLTDLRVHCAAGGIPYRTCDRIAEDHYDEAMTGIDPLEALRATLDP